MKWPWKKKPKDELEKQGEEREISFTTPIGGYKKKETFKVKDKTDNSSIQKRVWENTIKLRPREFKTVDLELLQRDSIVSVECIEREGNNFAYYLLDDLNLKKYSKSKSPKTLLKDSGLDEYRNEARISITGHYYLVLESRATEHNRNVWYRIEVFS